MLFAHNFKKNRINTSFSYFANLIHICNYISLLKACGHNFTVNSTGRIQNPQLSGHYQPDVVCIWHFNSYQGHGYRLRVLTLGVETSPNCEHDFLSINSQKYCDSSQISQHTPVYNESVKVVFQSNESIQKNGFIMQYEMVGSTYFEMNTT